MLHFCETVGSAILGGKPCPMLKSEIHECGLSYFCNVIVELQRLVKDNYRNCVIISSKGKRHFMFCN